MYNSKKQMKMNTIPESSQRWMPKQKFQILFISKKVDKKSTWKQVLDKIELDKASSKFWKLLFSLCSAHRQHLL